MILKLRIYVSALFVLAVAFVASCWIRSYWRIDRALYIGSPVTEISSYRGAIHIYRDDAFLVPVYRWDFAGGTIQKEGNSYKPRPSTLEHDTGLRLIIPYWMMISLCCLLVVAPWFRRFSVRMLLVAITLCALAIWMIVVPK